MGSYTQSPKTSTNHTTINTKNKLQQQKKTSSPPQKTPSPPQKIQSQHQTITSTHNDNYSSDESSISSLNSQTINLAHNIIREDQQKRRENKKSGSESIKRTLRSLGSYINQKRSSGITIQSTNIKDWKQRYSRIPESRSDLNITENALDLAIIWTNIHKIVHHQLYKQATNTSDLEASHLTKFLKHNENQEEPKPKKKPKDALAKILEQEALNDQEEGFQRECEIDRLERDKEILNKKVKELEETLNTRKTDIQNLETQQNKLLETRSEEEDHMIREMDIDTNPPTHSHITITPYKPPNTPSTQTPSTQTSSSTTTLSTATPHLPLSKPTTSTPHLPPASPHLPTSTPTPSTLVYSPPTNNTNSEMNIIAYLNTLDKVQKYNQHISILTAYHDNESTPKSLDRSRFPPPLLPRDTILTKKIDEVIKRCQQELIQTTINHLTDLNDKHKSEMNNFLTDTTISQRERSFLQKTTPEVDINAWKKVANRIMKIENRKSVKFSHPQTSPPSEMEFTGEIEYPFEESNETGTKNNRIPPHNLNRNSPPFFPKNRGSPNSSPPLFPKNRGSPNSSPPPFMDYPKDRTQPNSHTSPPPLMDIQLGTPSNPNLDRTYSPLKYNKYGLPQKNWDRNNHTRNQKRPYRHRHDHRPQPYHSQPLYHPHHHQSQYSHRQPQPSYHHYQPTYGHSFSPNDHQNSPPHPTYRQQ